MAMAEAGDDVEIGITASRPGTTPDDAATTVDPTRSVEKAPTSPPKSVDRGGPTGRFLLELPPMLERPPMTPP